VTWPLAGAGLASNAASTKPSTARYAPMPATIDLRLLIPGPPSAFDVLLIPLAWHGHPPPGRPNVVNNDGVE
jgi:hypothetical protein